MLINNSFYFLYVCRGSNVKIDDDELLIRINCYCHLLSNVVEQMCAIEPVKAIIDKSSALVSYVRSSGLGVNCSPSLKKYVDTRWNTVHDMLDSVLLNYVTLSRILLEKEEADGRSNVLGMLTSISRTDLEVICEFLAKIKIWTKQLESDKKPTLWMVWPIYINLKKHLNDFDGESDLIREMKKTGREYISKNISDFTPKLEHKIGTVLNPMLKNIAIASSEEREEVYTRIDLELRNLSTMCDEEMQGVEEIQSGETVTKDILDDFVGPSTSGGSQSQENYTEELQRYLQYKLPVSNLFEFNLVNWWFEHRYSFKNLFRLFLKKAGICASSAPSERSFSTTAIILEARRSCLIPETVQDLILARNKYLQFE